MSRTALFSILTLFALAISAWAYDFSATFNFTPEVAPRTSLEIEGLRIEFPEDEADVVENIQGRLLWLRETRRAQIEEEVRAFKTLFNNQDLGKSIRGTIAQLLAKDDLRPGYEARFDAAVADYARFGDCWKNWSGDLGIVRLYSTIEAKTLYLKKQLYVFDQIRYAVSGKEWGFYPPFMGDGVGLDSLIIEPDETSPLELDLLLLYRPGRSAELIGASTQEFISVIPETMRSGMANKLARIGADWLNERLIWDEIEPMFKNDQSILEHAVGRYLFSALLHARDGQEAFVSRMARIFQFVQREGQTLEQFRADLESLEMRADHSKSHPHKRRLVRDLTAYSLMKLTAESPGVFQSFKAKGIQISKSGFDWATFEAALDRCFGGELLLAATFEKERLALVESLKSRIAQKADEANPDAHPLAELHPLQVSRVSKTFGETTFTFPPEMAEAVDEIGAEFAEIFSTGRNAIADTLDEQERVEIRFEEKDFAALRAYGTDVDPEITKAFAAYGEMFANPKTVILRLVAGRKVNIWPKAHLREILSTDGHEPSFVYDSESDTISYVYNFNANPSAIQSLTQKGLESSIEKIIPALEWPVILPDDYTTDAGVSSMVKMIREKADDALKGYREADPDHAKGMLGGGLRFMSPEIATFMAVHEGVEIFLVNRVIASPDRRWFCDGLANWVAMQELDRRFGDGAGKAAFEAAYPSEKLTPLASKVQILDWLALEDVNSAENQNPEIEAASYYFSTLALIAALEGRDATFLKSWLEEIQKTPWNRTNTNTVIAAYDKLASGDLRTLLQSVTTAE